MQEIEAYQFSWHPQRGCHFRLKIKNARAWTKSVAVTASDLAAVAAILNEKPVYFDPQTGTIFTGPEPPGES